VTGGRRSDGEPPRGSGRGGGGRPVKARTASSRRWLDRQHRDPYVAEARRLGYRSRAAFKLMELDDRCRLLRRGARVVDLGATPGGWTQVAVARIGAGGPGGGRVVAVDRAPMEPVAGARFLLGDAFDDATAAAIVAALGGTADVVLSDMAPAATGHPGTDHLRIVALAEAAVALAVHLLAPGGAFVCKVLQGGTETTLLQTIKQRFASVRHLKPPASRAESAEVYLVATGFRP
jgi:23S rRNA (uridine2552-2'-O)-methyltransferase